METRPIDYFDACRLIREHWLGESPDNDGEQFTEKETEQLIIDALCNGYKIETIVSDTFNAVQVSSRHATGQDIIDLGETPFDCTNETAFKISFTMAFAMCLHRLGEQAQ